MTLKGTRLQIHYYDKDDLEMHPANMRLIADDGKLQELAASILHQGIIQPLVGVRSQNGNGRVQIVVGNRRLKAARLLGDKAPPLPVIVREDLTDQAQMEMMAVENLQRVDVDPISEGMHYRRLIDEHEVTRNEIARRTGKCLTHVKNRLELLALQPPVQRLIASGQLPIGAGAHLLTIEDPKVQTDVAIRLADMGLFSLDKIAQVAKKVQAGCEERTRRPQPKKSGYKGLDRIAEAMGRSRELGIDGEGLSRLDGSLVPWEQLNTALQATCAACQVGQIKTRLKWGDLLNAAERTCNGCGLTSLQDACEQCPLVEALSYLHKLLVLQI